MNTSQRSSVQSVDRASPPVSRAILAGVDALTVLIEHEKAAAVEAYQAKLTAVEETLKQHTEETEKLLAKSREDIAHAQTDAARAQANASKAENFLNHIRSSLTHAGIIDDGAAVLLDNEWEYLFSKISAQNSEMSAHSRHTSFTPDTELAYPGHRHSNLFDAVKSMRRLLDTSSRVTEYWKTSTQALEQEKVSLSAQILEQDARIADLLVQLKAQEGKVESPSSKVGDEFKDNYPYFKENPSGSTASTSGDDKLDDLDEWLNFDHPSQFTSLNPVMDACDGAISFGMNELGSQAFPDPLRNLFPSTIPDIEMLDLDSAITPHPSNTPFESDFAMISSLQTPYEPLPLPAELSKPVIDHILHQTNSFEHEHEDKESEPELHSDIPAGGPQPPVLTCCSHRPIMRTKYHPNRRRFPCTHANKISLRDIPRDSKSPSPPSTPKTVRLVLGAGGEKDRFIIS